MPFVGNPQPAPAWLPGPLARRWDEGSSAIATTLKRAKTARRISPSRRLKLPYEDVELRTEDGVRLAAWYVPGKEGQGGPKGLFAVIHHHYGGQRATALPWTALFHRLGIPSLSFDARGHGDSEAAPPGRGSFVRRAADVVAACEEARRRGAERLLGFGQSQGAASLAMAVSGRPDLAGCIFDSGPAPEMGTAAWGLAGNMLGFRTSSGWGTRALLAARILPGTEPLRYPWALWGALRGLRKVPLLWMHGDQDRVIAPSWARAWYGWGRQWGASWEHIGVPGADHVRGLQVGGEAVEQRIAAFLAALPVGSAGDRAGQALE